MGFLEETEVRKSSSSLEDPCFVAFHLSTLLRMPLLTHFVEYWFVYQIYAWLELTNNYYLNMFTFLLVFDPVFFPRFPVVVLIVCCMALLSPTRNCSNLRN